jgi:hypothetical protein
MSGRCPRESPITSPKHDGKSLLKEGRIGQRRWCVNDIYILSYSPDHWIPSKFSKKVLFNAFYESIDKTIYCLKWHYYKVKILLPNARN